MVDEFKRHVAYKLRIGDINNGSAMTDGEKLKFIQIGQKQASRVNLIANVTEKYVQDDEKKFASITLDDASGQIKVKAFGEDIEKFSDVEQGDTLMVIGMLRQWNNEIYILPEIIRKKEPSYLLLRKLETDLDKPKEQTKEQISELKDKILTIIKREEANGGTSIESISNETKSTLETINAEIKKLLEEGIIYEPRPGKVRYLG